MKVMSIVGRRLSLIATLFAVGGACTASENVRIERDGAVSGNTGAAGDDPSGAGGMGAGQGTAGEGAASGSAGAAGMGSGGYPGTSTGAAAEGGRSGTAGAGGPHADAGAGSAGASGQAGATGSDADPMEAMYGSYATFIGPLLNLRCGGCHLGTQIQGGFVVGYAGVTAHVSSANSNCSGLDASKLRVVPGKSANSLVYIKTNDASPPGGCGGHMPYSGTSLPTDEEMGLKYWIDTGARP